MGDHMETDSVIMKIKEIGIRYRVDKLVLFGSRARGDYSSVSDYDIAVFGQHLSASDQAYLYNDIDEIATLRKIDVLFVNDGTTPEMLENITKDGVVLYEQ